MFEAMLLTAVSLFFTLVYELGRVRWMCVFAWLSWWLLALSWLRLEPSSWTFPLLCFGVGLIYFLRMLMEVVQPSRIRRMVRSL